MTIYQRDFGGSGSGAAYDVDDIAAISARWPRVAEWRPDLSQTGFPGTLIRFGTTDTLVAPTGASLATSIRHRAMTDNNSTGTTACIVREALDGTGADGNASVTAEAGFEILAVLRYTQTRVGQWGGVVAFASAGSFPFADLYSLADVIGVGYTTVDTDTAIGDLEAISTSGTTAGTRTRTTITGARDEDQWIMCSVQVRDGTATFRVRNLETGVDADDVTHTTNLPAGAVLHVGVLANNGGVGTCGLDVAYIAVGMPA